MVSIFLILYKALSVLPHINSMLFALFSIAFNFASSIASSLISIPSIFFAFSLTYIPIEPVPQYKSKTLSFSFTFSFM